VNMGVFSSRYLRFNSSPKAKSFDVLWPVYVYRVSYFESNDITLNIFQEGILGLFRAGCKRTDEISQLLDLDKNLVAFITATQLQPNGWLDDNGKITNEGGRVLDGESRQKGSLYKDAKPSKSKQKMGYIFWDVIGQSWMPRFSKKLDEIESEGRLDSFPSFSAERQKGGTFKPYCLRVSFHQAPKVDKGEEIIAAYRSYRLDIHHSRQLNTRSIQQNEEFWMSNIKSISEDPEPMYLWVSVFHHNKSNELWSIQDPFGVRTTAPWLRESFLSTINKQAGLAKKMSHLIGEPQAKKQTAEEWLTTLDQKVRLEILLDYPYLKNQPDISRYLQAVKHRQEEIKGGNSRSSNLESLLTDAQKLIESTLKWMLGEWTVDLSSLPNANQPISKEQKIRIYQSLDLSVINPITDQLSNQGWRQVHTVLRYKNDARASLKALLCSAILSTVDNQEHPFKKLQADVLDFPKLLKLADLRNQAGHASGDNFDKEEVVELCDFAVDWVSNFKGWL